MAQQSISVSKNYRLPCASTSNAFGETLLPAYSMPPDFFGSNVPKRWVMPPASVCVWPYEEMYLDDVKVDGKYNNDIRRERANAFFHELEPRRSLIFYHANFSNPFSEEGANRYVVVGISRVKTVGDEMLYEGLSPAVMEKYAQGMVWQRLIETTYPDEGLRLPYHVYEDRPELLEKFLYVADNHENFKYATRHISDDEALGMVERFRELVLILKEMGDTTDNWDVRLRWLDDLIAELWKSRGLFPGLPSVLSYLRLDGAIPYFKSECLIGRERDAKDHVFSVLNGAVAPGWSITEQQLKSGRKIWWLLTDPQRRFFSETFLRFALSPSHLKTMLGDPSVYDLEALSKNPYQIAESYQGTGPAASVSFDAIDRGMLPSPELGEAHRIDLDDESRLRALMIDVLQQEPAHVFLSENRVLDRVNARLAHLPEWKTATFHNRYIDLYQAFLNQSLVFRRMDAIRYVYLRAVYEDERLVEDTCIKLAGRADLPIRIPLTESHWIGWLSDAASPIREQDPDEYQQAIKEQSEQCAKIFSRPLSIISGNAGTGKTTVIRGIIKAIERVQGAGARVVLLAPTGKAADRMRQATGRPAQTVHSFLARLQWLKDGHFVAFGGAKETSLATYIIDEASMLNLETVATLFRSIDHNAIERLIFVGDPNQLPPIGRGRFYADLIEWVHASYSESHARLSRNIRQMENQITGKGTGILELANVFLHSHEDNATNRDEILLSKIQEGGLVDKDLTVVYWDNATDLYEKLVGQLIQNMEEQTGDSHNEKAPYLLWRKAFNDYQNPDTHQVISPYRSEEHGTSNLNSLLQRESNQFFLDNKGSIGGITAGDKVIQIVNRTQSNPVYAFDLASNKKKPTEVFNGEIGFTWFPLYHKNWNKPYYHITELQVRFSRKRNLVINIPSGNYVEENLELAYAISVHKAQGSEFDVVYFVLPSKRSTFLSTELVYTALTRASRRCVLFLQNDISPLLWSRRLEQSALIGINSSLFTIRIVPPALEDRGWYEEGKVHHTLSEFMVRSKSEVIISNLLADRDIPFLYEAPLRAPDGTFCLPDFTVTAGGRQWYWEHLGMLDKPEYRTRWEQKRAWYDRWFPGQLLTTEDSPELSTEAVDLISKFFS